MGHVSLGHYLVAVEGLALFRRYFAGEWEQAERLVSELAQLVTHPDQPPMSVELEIPEMDVQAGYASWAGTYDSQPNALIRVEQPVMQALIDAVEPGDALDAACGTGRHTAYLHARGHRVVGVDTCGPMLERARAALPQVEFRVGDLVELPIDSRSVDLAVCALALTHCETLAPAIAELTRVLRPGGRLLLSDFHPVMMSLGGTAFFLGTDGVGQVRSYFHTHSAYLSAFRSAGLEVQQCVEPLFAAEDIGLMAAMFGIGHEAFRTAFVGMPGALVWQLGRRE